jgi:hypothetical protein
MGSDALGVPAPAIKGRQWDNPHMSRAASRLSSFNQPQQYSGGGGMSPGRSVVPVTQ